MANAPAIRFNRFDLLNLVFHEQPGGRLPDPATAVASEIVVNAAIGRPLPPGERGQPAESWEPDDPDQPENKTERGDGAERVARLRLIVTIVPDPRLKPYHIVVDALGTFSTRQGTYNQLADFCRGSAPGIMFPQIREIVHRISSYGHYGEVPLDSIDLNQLLNQSPWTAAP
jgi:hypothetical protein